MKALDVAADEVSDEVSDEVPQSTWFLRPALEHDSSPAHPSHLLAGSSRVVAGDVCQMVGMSGLF